MAVSSTIGVVVAEGLGCYVLPLRPLERKCLQLVPQSSSYFGREGSSELELAHSPTADRQTGARSGSGIDNTAEVVDAAAVAAVTAVTGSAASNAAVAVSAAVTVVGDLQETVPVLRAGSLPSFDLAPFHRPSPEARSCCSRRSKEHEAGCPWPVALHPP